MRSTFTRLFVSASAMACVISVAGCGAGLLEDDISSVAPSSSSCNTATYPDIMGYSARLNKYKNDAQCGTQVQAAESWRQNAIAACSAGNLASATTAYDNYKKSVQVVNSFCS